MANRLFVLSAFVLIHGIVVAQAPDASVIVYQSTLNGFLNAVGPVSGTERFSVLGISGNYTWSLRNARIEIKPDRAEFIADANVRVGPVSYSSGAVGDVEVRYHPETNRISVKVLRAVFEVYTKILGRKIHIADLDAAKFYRPEFEFAGPQPVQPKVEILLPDRTIKTIYIMPVSQQLHLDSKQIVVTSQLAFSDHPMRSGIEERRPPDRR